MVGEFPDGDSPGLRYNIPPASPPRFFLALAFFERAKTCSTASASPTPPPSIPSGTNRGPISAL